uniref:Uncharacterized protein n=1 Tax=Ditylenchus dipsaci TaxID=166011 RepID=A0A915E1R1_9BILA
MQCMLFYSLLFVCIIVGIGIFIQKQAKNTGVVTIKGTVECVVYRNESNLPPEEFDLISPKFSKWIDWSNYEWKEAENATISLFEEDIVFDDLLSETRTNKGNFRISGKQYEIFNSAVYYLYVEATCPPLNKHFKKCKYYLQDYVAGFSNVIGKFFISYVALVSDESGWAYEVFMRAIAGLSYRPDVLMADGD